MLGVTGGIAAYKTAELVRLLVKDGVVVDVVMTEAATRFVTPTTFQALSGRPVLTDLWSSGADNAMGHIGVSRGAQAIVVAPASANFLAKLAHGVADDLLSTLCLARECPLLVAPAMNVQMWQNPATQRNVAQLAEDGVSILGPGSGELACNEFGDGRMLEADDLFAAITAAAPAEASRRQACAGHRGPDVRSDRSGARHHELELRQDGLRDRASGRRSGRRGDDGRGSDPFADADGRGAHRRARARRTWPKRCSTACDDADVFVAVAAVADYTPIEASERKLKKTGDAADAEARADRRHPCDRRRLARRRRSVSASPRKATTWSRTARRSASARSFRCSSPTAPRTHFGSDDNEVTLLDDAGAHPLPRMDKLALARRLVAEIAQRLAARS